MTAREAYKILELEYGSSLEQIKKNQRRLIKIWHPDRFIDAEKKNKAHFKTVQINQASGLLKRIKHASTYTRENKPKNPTENNYRNKDVNLTQKKRTQNQKKTKKRHFVRFHGLSRLDIFLGRISTKNHLFFLKSRSTKSIKKAQLNTQKVNSIFQKKYYHFKQIYIIGFYRSWINKFFFAPSNTHSQGLGSYSIKSKYEAIVNYEQIKDVIFYSVNKSWNVGLKYAFGIVIVGLMIRTILFNLYKGVAVYGWDIFFFQELTLMLAFLSLFLPDHIFQRVLLSRYHNYPAKKVKQFFSDGKKLPDPWSKYFHSFMLVKFTFVMWLIV